MLDKADKHAMSLRLSSAEMAKIDHSELAGMTEDDIEDEHQEYVHYHRDKVSHMTNHAVGRRRRCYIRKMGVLLFLCFLYFFMLFKKKVEKA